MTSRETKRYTAANLPPEVHADLVETLFGTVGSFLSGLFGGLLVPVIALMRTGESKFLACTVVVLALATFRIAVLVLHNASPVAARRRQARMWEIFYAFGGIGFMTAVGITAGLLLAGRHDEVTALYGVVIVLGCAGALAGRNAGRPAIVLGQVVGVCLPVLVTLLFQFDAWYWGLAAIFGLVITSVKSTTRFLNGHLVSAMLARREAQEQRERFGTALNSMSHGLCMTGSDGAITVINERLRAFFDIPDQLRDLSVEVLALRIAHHGRMAPDASAAFVDGLRRHVAGASGVWVQVVAQNTYLFRCERMANDGTVMVVEDVTEARRAAEKVERMAHFDTLTALPNRFQFYAQMRALLRNPPPAAESALISIDLDRFKEINDTLGHPAGDKLLRQVADRLRLTVDTAAHVARFGGDEFQVLLPTIVDAELDAFAAKLVARISEPYSVDGHTVSIGASIGMAVAPRDATQADELMKCADMALYDAKGAGRGTFRRYAARMGAAIKRKRQIEEELREALAAGHLEVHYQPVVEARTGRIRNCEALVRWRHPLRGLVPPDQFIPVAEETGLIVELGDFVLRRACRDAMTWPDTIGVAVNVSSKQFALRSDFVERVGAILAETGLPSGRLEVEITEGTLVDAADALADLTGRGVRISLDDFGTGYSSLSYLRQFTVHKIKIDRSFIRDPDDRAALAVIDAVALLAHAIDIDLVVEGVETAQQLQLVQDKRVNLVQGYLFSPPKPLAEIAPALREELLLPLDALPVLLRSVA